MFKKTIYILAVCSGFLLAQAHAQVNYALDPSFGTGGIYRLSTTGAAFYVGDMARQADGKIVNCGAFVDADLKYDSAGIFRLNANGIVDSSYGTYGFARIPIPPGGIAPCAGDVKLLPNGKAAIAIIYYMGTLLKPAIMVMDSNGHADTGFNGGQPIALAAAAEQGFTTELVIQAGKFVTVYSHGPSTSFAVLKATVARYNANGTLDSSFATYGTYTVSGNAVGDVVTADPDGRIYFSLYQVTPANNVLAHSIFRIDTNGNPDTTWGTNGKSDTVMLNTSTNSYYSTFAINKDGTVMANALGGGTPPAFNYNLWQYTTSGHLNRTFGTNGVKTLSISGFDANYAPNAVATNGNKLIMMTEQPSVTVPGTRDILLVQTDSTGNFDSTFGTNGILRTPMGKGYSGWMEPMTDGTIYVGACLAGSKGEVFRFKQTPVGFAVINNKMSAKVFPNPAMFSITLDCDAGVLYALYSLTGKEILGGTTVSKRTLIDLGHVVPGIYSLVCTDGRNNIALQIVKL